MARVAWLGLGQMGTPMAARLLGAGHDLAVWNRTAEKADALVEGGASRAANPAEAVAGCEAVVTMLADPDAVRAVVLSEEGAAGSLEEGSTLIEMSTVGPGFIAELAEGMPDGRSLLDAPVLGSTPQAESGSLNIFVGGSEEVFESRRALLELMGTPVYVGEQGSGAAMKLVANSGLLNVLAAIGEALGFGDALGLAPEQVLDVLENSPIGATVKRKRELIESGRYPPNFKLGLAGKDVRLVVEAARARGLEPRLAGATAHWFEAAEAEGHESLDYSAVIATIRGRSASL